MNYKVENKFSFKIKQKVVDGIFIEGKNCRFSRFEQDKSLPKHYAYLMQYKNFKFKDVPKEAQTKEFFLNMFTYSDVFNYIKSHIKEFDRQFFKDLITTNPFALTLDNNCFSIIPIEYIDEEMCSLAILQNKNWCDYTWFYLVVERKPQVLTEDLWKLGARLYAREVNGKNKFLSITPEKYKDYEYYLEMCSCNFNENCPLDTNKGHIIDTIPKEILSLRFVLDLLKIDIQSVARFNEQMLEMKIPYCEETEKIWQFVVRHVGETIRNIKLNEERIEFFLRHYAKDSHEYIWCFKNNFKRYLKKKRNLEALKKTEERTRNFLENTSKMALNGINQKLKQGENPIDAINDTNQLLRPFEKSYSISQLPIKYEGEVPIEFRKQLDTEEYLQMFYKKIGVQIIEEEDNLFYSVVVPEGWSEENDGCWCYVKDENGNPVIDYVYQSVFYDRDAYVKRVYLSKLEQEENRGRK